MQGLVVRNAPARTARVEVYDFRTPPALSREQLRSLESGLESVARAWIPLLMARVRANCRVDPAGLTTTSYDDLITSLPESSAAVLCVFDGVASRGFVQFPTSGSLGWIARMVGGAGKSPAPADHPLTPIESALVRRIVDDLLPLVGDGWAAQLVVRPVIGSSIPDLDEAKAAAPGQAMLAARLIVSVEGVETPVLIAVPVTAFRSRTESAGDALPAEEAASRLRRAIHDAPVTVGVRYRSAHVSPSRILDLAVGDVFRLPHPRFVPLDVTVDGDVVAHAAAGSTGARLACVVVPSEES